MNKGNAICSSVLLLLVEYRRTQLSANMIHFCFHEKSTALSSIRITFFLLEPPNKIAQKSIPQTFILPCPV